MAGAGTCGRVLRPAAVALGAARHRPARRPARAPAADDLVRMRCATDGADIVTTWRGTAYGDERPAAPASGRALGMNIARCARGRSRMVHQLSRAHAVPDPDTGDVLHRWTNPCTGSRDARPRVGPAVEHVACVGIQVQHQLARADEPSASVARAAGDVHAEHAEQPARRGAARSRTRCRARW